MPKSKYSNIKISGISFVMPDNKNNSNTSDCEFFYTSPKAVTNVDMCEAAVKDLIANMHIDVNSLDALIFVNQYPDHLSPSSSHIIHKRLGLPTTCSVFDIYHGGSGFIYGLFVAGSMLSIGKYKKVILLLGEHINEENTNFEAGYCLSSGGAAIFLEYDNTVDNMYFLFGVDSSKYDDIIIPAGAYRLPITNQILNETINDNKNNKWTLKQKLININSFKEFVYNNIPNSLNELLLFSNYTVDDIDFFAFNQFNKEIVDYLAEQNNIPSLKYSTDTYKKYGNQTILSSLANIIDILGSKLETKKNRLCFITYGEGLSYGLSIMSIDKIYCSRIKIMGFENCIMPDEFKTHWIEKIQNSQ